MPRPDALTKVSGAERFAVDWFGPNLLWAGVKRAGNPHAEIRQLHLEDAKNTPGVVTVLTARDVGGTNRASVVPSPSWPEVLLPQQRTPPPVVKAQVFSPPAARAATPPDRPLTSVGTLRLVVVPSPN